MTAYMYFDPETEKGVLFAFRQEECNADTLDLTLPFKDSSWLLTDEDTGETLTAADGSITLSLPEKRTAKLYWMKKA